ncbi:YidH family protein [Nocardioides sp. BYT-33-1]|uniref:YidH family protein n=1 Tax=Nocardioides sp. BYT-33-1 TaxID=3416952 RepID=UPI003F52C618
MRPEAPGTVVDYRFTLANERTFLAWIRTALGLSAAAVAVVHLVPADAVPLGLRAAIGLVLACVAVYVAVAGVVRWRRVDRAIEAGAALPTTGAAVVLACCVAGCGVLTVAVVAMAL